MDNAHSLTHARTHTHTYPQICDHTAVKSTQGLKQKKRYLLVKFTTEGKTLTSNPCSCSDHMSCCRKDNRVKSSIFSTHPKFSSYSARQQLDGCPLVQVCSVSPCCFVSSVSGLHRCVLNDKGTNGARTWTLMPTKIFWSEKKFL